MPESSESKSLPHLPARFRFTPEFRLLIACSWIAPAPLEALQAERIVALCGEGIDWEAFVTLVDLHRVPALVYAALRRYAADRLPAGPRERLKERSDHAHREALRHASESVRIIKKFDVEGIGVLLLKGPVLSQQLFGDPGMRYSMDMDLLLRPEDLDRADRFLKAEGYRRTIPDFELTEKQKRVVLAEACHYEYFHNEKGLQLELHWCFELWTPEQMAELWVRRRLMTWLGIRVTCLDEDSLLLYLCDHGAHHKWFRLKWLSDVAVIFGQERHTGWDHLLALAARLDLRRPLAQAALLAHWLYEIPLAEPLRAWVRGEKTAISLGSIAVRAALGSYKEHTKDLSYFMRLRAKLTYRFYLKNLLISPMDIMRFPLPDKLFWLYVPLRPLFWFRRHYMGDQSQVLFFA